MQCMVLAVMVWARVVWIHTCIVSCCHGYFIVLLGNKASNCVCMWDESLGAGEVLPVRYLTCLLFYKVC